MPIPPEVEHDSVRRRSQVPALSAGLDNNRRWSFFASVIGRTAAETEPPAASSVLWVLYRRADDLGRVTLVEVKVGRREVNGCTNSARRCVKRDRETASEHAVAGARRSGAGHCG